MCQFGPLMTRAGTAVRSARPTFAGLGQSQLFLRAISWGKVFQKCTCTHPFIPTNPSHL